MAKHVKTDEELAYAEWKKFHRAIKKYGLDEMDNDQWHHDPSTRNSAYMYDGFFAGFYAARDMFKDK